VSLSLSGTFFRNFGGALDTVGGSLTLRTGSHLSAALAWARNSVDLPGGGFDADLASLRLAWAFTTRLVGSAFVQYNSLDREVLANLRIVFTHRPGSDLFLVLNEERGSERSAWSFARRALAVKLTWLVRF
jgi:hypothetical protein